MFYASLAAASPANCQLIPAEQLHRPAIIRNRMENLLFAGGQICAPELQIPVGHHGLDNERVGVGSQGNILWANILAELLFTARRAERGSAWRGVCQQDAILRRSRAQLDQLELAIEVGHHNQAVVYREANRGAGTTVRAISTLAQNTRVGAVAIDRVKASSPRRTSVAVIDRLPVRAEQKIGAARLAS